MSLAILALLNAIDAILTLRVLEKGGREMNPLLAPLMKRFGALPVLIVSKVALIVIVYAFSSEPLTWGLCVGYALLCAWNFRELRK